MLVGNHGYGGLPIALAIAQYLNCENPGENDSCGNCNSCKKNLKLVHPDLHLVFPVNTTPEVKKDPISSHFISQWREAVIENPYLSFEQWFEKLGIERKQGIISVHESKDIIKSAILKPFEGKYKIFVIWMVEKMHRESSTKLLKIIEEPNPGTIFLLVAESKENILPTILSRVQTYQVSRISDGEISEKLSEEVDDPDKVAKVVHLAEGSWSEARRLSGMEGEEDFFSSIFVDWMRDCYQVKIEELIAFSDKMSKIGREKQKYFFRFALSILRESLLQNYHAVELSRVSGEIEKFKTNFAPFIHDANAIELVNEISEASYHIERNGNAKVIFLDLSLKVVKLLKSKSVTL